MSVGFIGLGKLGLPCAAALSVEAGLPVNGFDLNPKVAEYIDSCQVPYQESRIEEYLRKANLTFYRDINEFLRNTDIVFIAVQTPHDPIFEGTTPVPAITKDFNYEFLIDANFQIANFLRQNTERSITVVVISTVLPGTMRDYVLPLYSDVSERLRFCYNPFFIAMGTTIPDYLNPEFVLMGEASDGDSSEVVEMYSRLHSAPVRKMRIESAELTKVAYNTFIGFKIVFSNTLAEIVDQRGGDVDEVTSALAAADQRLISPKYLKAGMADGGGCHPRDQIAMSWLAGDANLSANIFDFLARARDAQTLRQAQQILQVHKDTGLPVCVLGLAYKAEVNLVVGSPSLLLLSFLENMEVNFITFDPFCLPTSEFPSDPHLFFVATNHAQFRELSFPQGSVVIDPWGDAISKVAGCRVIRPGRK